MIDVEQGLNVGHVGLAGEFRCVVKNADGTIKIDTAYQKNLILNQGLDFFGGTNGEDMLARCVIGSGNSSPIISQNKLDAYLSIAIGAVFASNYNYTPDTSGLYKTSRTYKYVFTGLNNVNVSELGLSSQGNSASDYHLCTRALIKDTLGNPISITILSGEVLEVYYKLWQVFSITSVTHTVSMLNGKGGSTPYTVSCSLLGVGAAADWYDTAGSALSSKGSTPNGLYNGEPGDIQSFNPLGARLWEGAASFVGYTNSSYKKILNIILGTGAGNGSIRTVTTQSTMGKWQLRYGSVSNDSPIVKTNKETLKIPIEFSWGRYEGGL